MTNTSNPFRSASGNRYLEGLFFERTLADKSSVIYTLKDQDHLGFKSLYRLYMETGDPFEYRFAVAYLDGWEHWTMLCDCTWFKPLVARWRKELELRLRSEALVRMIADAKSVSKSSAISNRHILEKGWAKEDKGRGRPSKQEIKAEASRLATARQDATDDLARMQPSTLQPVN